MALCALLLAIGGHDGLHRHGDCNGVCRCIITAGVGVLGRRCARSLRCTVGLAGSVRLARPLTLGLCDLGAIFGSSVVTVGFGCRCTVVRGAVGAISAIGTVRAVGAIGTIRLGSGCRSSRAILGRTFALGSRSGVNASHRRARRFVA